MGNGGKMTLKREVCLPNMGERHQRHPGMIALSENTNKETARDEIRLQMSFQLWQISEKEDELSAHIWWSYLHGGRIRWSYKEKLMIGLLFLVSSRTCFWNFIWPRITQRFKRWVHLSLAGLWLWVFSHVTLLIKKIFCFFGCSSSMMGNMDIQLFISKANICKQLDVIRLALTYFWGLILNAVLTKAQQF